MSMSLWSCMSDESFLLFLHTKVYHECKSRKPRTAATLSDSRRGVAIRGAFAGRDGLAQP